MSGIRQSVGQAEDDGKERPAAAAGRRSGRTSERPERVTRIRTRQMTAAAGCLCLCLSALCVYVCVCVIA